MRKLFKGGNYSREETSFFLLNIEMRNFRSNLALVQKNVFMTSMASLASSLASYYGTKSFCFISIFTQYNKTDYLGGKLFKGGNYSRAETSFLESIKA